MESWKTVVVCVLVATVVCRSTAMPRSSEVLEEDGVPVELMKRTNEEVAARTETELIDGSEKEKLSGEDAKKIEDSTLESKLQVRFPEESKQVVDLTEKDDVMRSKKSPGARDQHMYMRHMPGTTVCIHVRSDHSQVVCGPQAEDKKEEKLAEQTHPSARFAYQRPEYYGEEPRNLGYMRSAQEQLPLPYPPQQTTKQTPGGGQPKRVQSGLIPVSPFRTNAPARGVAGEEIHSPQPTELSQPAGSPGRGPSVVVHRQYIPQYVPQPMGLRLNCAYQPDGIPLMQPFGMPLRAYPGEQFVNIQGNNLGARMADSAEIIDEPHYLDTPRQMQLDQTVGSSYPTETILGSTYLDSNGNSYFIDESQARANDQLLAKQWEQQQLFRATEEKEKEKKKLDLTEANDQLKELREQVMRLQERVSKTAPPTEEKELDKDKTAAATDAIQDQTSQPLNPPKTPAKSSKRNVRAQHA